MSSYYRKPLKQKTVLKEFKILFVAITIFWAVEIADFLVFNGGLDQYGIQPHSIIGLRGIVFAPFLHGGFPHLIANTIPFLTLGWLTMIQATKDFFVASIMSALIGGAGVWLFGSPQSVHIGASILIYGYLGFLLLRGYFQKNFPSIALSIFVAIAYGGFIWGVFPSQMGVSWQGHLFGFIGGAIAAKMVTPERNLG
ncbi:rhomboid family intramembrane serine protease [Pleurocapsa sp. CCALA 161]|uniref:rhomboid family intramembrane serine protease n=1 Tax=Pleurocapsa sp. CCALA 161 TaxID=2107688 RepID=UPI000D05EF35|nr:rhomboid family intramembrane serine protease [Pleurocapsa sp. CCALA 161]PSB06760.1 rhomboid family intramembrane serine protease [Pleurocapsa sp. CCALA 161]